MAFEERIAAAFGMDDETWARHSNPWSVWTRNTVLPTLVLAVWSRAWLGRWALVPVALAVFWMWLNPRLFARPASTRSWASKAVLGERVWLNRGSIPVPEHHRRVPHLLNAFALSGVPLVVWGLAALRIWPLLLGCLAIFAGKLWFLDRMVWLYEDMKDDDPRYRAWLY